MTITIKDIAKLAGVDPSTVSRVIADNPRISKETKDRIIKVMEELDFHPNAIARSLANRLTRIVGVIMPHSTDQVFANPFFTEAMRGIGMSAHNRGYNVLFSTGSNMEEEYECAKSLINEKKVDAMILLTSRKDDRTIELMRKKQFPFVVIGKPSKDEDINWVDNDNEAAGYNAAEHLIQQGHKAIGFIGVDFSYVFMCDRFRGYKKALDEGHISFSKDLISLDQSLEEGGYNAMQRLLSLKERPTAVIAADDLMAFGAMRAIKDQGLKIPSDIAVVGFNDTRLASYVDPPLSSVEIFVYELGYNACEILLDQLGENKGIKKHIIVPANLKVRGSSQLKRASD